MAGLWTVRIVDQSLRPPKRNCELMTALREALDAASGDLCRTRSRSFMEAASPRLTSGPGCSAPCLDHWPNGRSTSRQPTPGGQFWCAAFARPLGPFLHGWTQRTPAEMRSPRRIGIHSEALQLVSLAAMLAIRLPFVGSPHSTCRRSLQACRQVLSVLLRIASSVIGYSSCGGAPRLDELRLSAVRLALLHTLNL